MTLGSGVFDKVLDNVGSKYTISVGSESFNDRGDSTTTYTTATGLGFVSILTDSDEAVKAGHLNIGDAIGYFKMNTEDMVTGSLLRVNHQGKEYDSWGDVIVPQFSGEQLIRKVFLRKV